MERFYDTATSVCGSPFSGIRGAAIIGAHKKAPSCQPGALVCLCRRGGHTGEYERLLSIPRSVRTDEFT